MAFEKVIVFGPTGNIGSITAQTASKKGAKVYLAMRDPKKTIPGLSQEDEQAGKYGRLQADLTDADSIRAAVQKSGAQAAFLYLAFGSPDHMLSAFQALKDGGIQQVVFLSSFTVPKDGLEDVQPADMISFVHSQAELSLRKVFAKEQLVAIRPGSFATNALHSKSGIDARKVKIMSPQPESDWITNEDMGEVSGTVLVEGQRDGQDVIYLFGPEMVSQRSAFEIIGKVLGEEIEVVEVGGEEALQEYISGGMPEPVAKYLISVIEKTDANGGAMELEPGRHEEGVANVKKYTGHSALRFEEWAGRNKIMFT
jgi:uncharacterized protein YbjT (DUF2867 family)